MSINCLVWAVVIMEHQHIRIKYLDGHHEATPTRHLPRAKLPIPPGVRVALPGGPEGAAGPGAAGGRRGSGSDPAALPRRHQLQHQDQYDRTHTSTKGDILDHILYTYMQYITYIY